MTVEGARHKTASDFIGGRSWWQLLRRRDRQRAEEVEEEIPFFFRAGNGNARAVRFELQDSIRRMRGIYIAPDVPNAKVIRAQVVSN